MGIIKGKAKGHKIEFVDGKVCYIILSNTSHILLDEVIAYIKNLSEEDWRRVKAAIEMADNLPGMGTAIEYT